MRKINVAPVSNEHKTQLQRETKRKIPSTHFHESLKNGLSQGENGFVAKVKGGNVLPTMASKPG